MNLSEYEAAATRVAFDRKPSEADLTLLGDHERWLIYRGLVRSRFFKVVKSALPRFAAVVDVDPLVISWLADAPPTARLFRLLPEQFFASVDWTAFPAWQRELAILEISGWIARYDNTPFPETTDFTFQGVPAMNPTAMVLRFEYPVYQVDQTEYARKPSNLCVYRNVQGKAMMWSLNDMSAALFMRFSRGDADVTTCVKEVCEARGAAIDERFLEKLGEIIAGALERGILLGSRA